ncbi:MAG: NAD(P)H-dependent oxidoreductase [Armatimonadetes bacterium]|nr:NAD(P)H-dependent oxidoreductase [Armatimonadota bacterium]
MTERPKLQITAILGTSRPGNFTGKALAITIDELRQSPDIEVVLIDPANMNLGFPGASEDPSDADRLREAVKTATGVVLATPEYHGSFAATMKLIIENLGFPSVLAGKPVALLGTAAGRIGAIKSLEQLRGVCSHVGAIVLPGPVSVAGVQTVFDEDGNCLDESVESLLRGVAASLLDYIKGSVCPKFALEQIVRERRT